MESLLLSIDKHGIQVPVTVYSDGDIYRLIDGERRWRCAKKLNLKTIPAIVQEKPSELENLVLMYNIHALREQWDYYTIASKLKRVIDLYRHENGEEPTEINLSELTGLTRGAIRRCRLLLELPQRFQDTLLQELEKPKAHQRLTEDFFIEMEKSLKTVTNRLPEFASRIDDVRDTLVQKYERKVISAVTDFRQLSKIATAVDNLGVAHKTAKRTLDRVFDRNDRFGIKEAYEQTVQFGYTERRAQQQASSLISFLGEVDENNQEAQLDAELLEQLRELYVALAKVLRS